MTPFSLPNTAEIHYEYDRHHRIIRETKPHGHVLENIYDSQGRIKEQRSPSGQRQELIPTATFQYESGVTTVEDACGGKTIYKMFNKQIYKIIDPLGHDTLQSWFIDEHSYFDPVQEKALAWDKPGAFPRSLKKSTDKRGLSTEYLYDERGNPIEISLTGDDLTGSGQNALSKTYTYNDLDLCIEEVVLDQKTITSYDKNFPQLPKRIERYSQDALSSFIEFTYDSSGQIEKEDRSGSITAWKYNSHGFPIEKTEFSQNSDPNVVTLYAYNYQGQCTETITADSVQKTSYDICGNQIESQLFSLAGKLLSATYIGYNLNNDPIWIQTANAQNTLYIDYNAAGLVKAKRQTITPNMAFAYTVYEYDPRGYLIEETDPLGYTTYRNFDSLGNITEETKEGHTVQFTYDAGSLIQSIHTPAGATTTRLHTTNGLLKKEIYPDGTETSFVYDVFGRPIKETKNGITWHINYDDITHKVIRLQPESNTTEIHQFDMRGNLISFTDNAGFVWSKTYDGLNRLKSEATPTGQTTSWAYHGDTVYTTRANNEVIASRYEAGQAVESNTYNATKSLIAQTVRQFDAVHDIETVLQGSYSTTTWLNTFGLPIKVQKGDHVTSYQYDLAGNCISSTDGDKRTTKKSYDGLGRMVQKELPDGSVFSFSYDLHSNIVNCRLPNGGTWNASYDLMDRKCYEELVANGLSFQKWQYVYEDGKLKQKTDSLNRIHSYSYDFLGRLTTEYVDGWQKTHAYDDRGLLSSTKLTTPSYETSLVERSYDADARLISESTYSNSIVLQHTEQKWGQSNRTVKIGDHERTFEYQNNQLVALSANTVALSYTYDLGSLQQTKTSPITSVSTEYTAAGMPKQVYTALAQEKLQETLKWGPSGKLDSYTSTKERKKFTYSPSGYLKSDGTERYECDFGAAGIGILTDSTNHHIQEHGVDLFGRVTSELWNKTLFETQYDSMGQTTSCNRSQYKWDPWGRLIEVYDGATTWKAAYDTFGRRLKTSYTSHGYFYNTTDTTISFYDPEKEFEEIGIKYNDHIFWKLNGPDSCDAVVDAYGNKAYLAHNALQQLTAVVTDTSTYFVEPVSSSYGPQGSFTTPSDVISYAKSLEWHSQSLDPTGLIWMGKRYYNPKFGRFLSADPVGYPAVVNLYSYANSDPVNYMDPDGRFASDVYKPVHERTIDSVSAAAKEYEERGIFAKSHRYSVGTYELTRGAIGFMNGIANDFGQAKKNGSQISQFASDAKIDSIYNASNTLPVDVVECFFCRTGAMSTPSRMYIEKWQGLIATKGPDSKFLEICHSGAADHLKNALKAVDDKIRKKIIVVAIAPSVIIPENLCYRSYNYVSKRDFVTHLDVWGKIRYGDELTILEPHPTANRWDHDFLSPTFDRVKQKHIKDYLELYGNNL